MGGRQVVREKETGNWWQQSFDSAMQNLTKVGRALLLLTLLKTSLIYVHTQNVFNLKASGMSNGTGSKQEAGSLIFQQTFRYRLLEGGFCRLIQMLTRVTLMLMTLTWTQGATEMAHLLLAPLQS